MSVSTLAEIVGDIETRLAELRPAVDEFRQLETAHVALTRDPDQPRAVRGSASGSRASGGANQIAVLKHVAEHPGASGAEIAEATGIARRTVHSTIYNLKRRGELTPSGDGVKLADRTQEQTAEAAIDAHDTSRGRPA